MHDWSALRLGLIFLFSSRYVLFMNHFNAILHSGEPAEGGFWATCLEVPGANGQEETREECLQNLAEAVKMILEINEEEALRDDPKAEKTDLVFA